MQDFSRRWLDIRERVLETIDQFGADGHYILGKRVKEFEVALAKFWGLKYSVGCASGLDALEIALRCTGVRPGSLVLTTPLSAFATTLAILRAGCEPVFVDTDDLGLVDLDLAREALEKRSIGTFIPVHLFGNSMNLTELQKLTKDFDLTLIEDCAQSIGARFDGRVTGSVGKFACTSFYPTKNLGCLGDGGAVLTDSLELAERAASIRNYGETSKYSHTYLGMNSRLDEIQAAVLARVFLPQLQTELQKRKEIAEYYLEHISHDQIRLPALHEKSESAWHLFPVFVPPEKRPNFLDHLSKSQIGSGVHYPKLIPYQEAMTSRGKVDIYGDLSNAKLLVESEVSLPIHPYLSQEDCERVVAVCNAWCG